VRERGKIVPRRITAVSAKKQRRTRARIKRSLFLGLLPTHSLKNSSVRPALAAD